MALHRLVLNTTLTATQDIANAKLNGTDSWYNVKRLITWLRSYVTGTRDGNMLLKLGTVQAFGLVTITGRPTADQTMTVCNQTLTAKDSGANGTTQFNTSNTDNSVTAANLAACINANTSLTGKVTAVASGDATTGVCTITAVVPGLIGNGLDLTEGMTNVAVTAFASGTDGTAYNMTLGKLIS